MRVALTVQPVEAVEALTAADADRVEWHAVLLVEGVPTGDGRIADPDSITWRELPLPLMAIDRTTNGHDDARLVGQITSIERIGAEIHAYGTWLADPDDEANRLRSLIVAGELSGVSVDLDAIEYVIEFRDEPWPEADDDGVVRVEGGTGDETFRYTAARIIGATALPFPAHPDAYIEPWGGAVTAAAPLRPPKAWFADPTLPAPTPLTVTDDGRVYGHLALWDSCHVGFADRCVTPPRSAAAYRHFTTGELVTAEGDRVPVGQITMDTGHAPLAANAARAAAHYDDTGTAVADVTAGEDRWGVWIAGAVRPGVDELTLRRFMAADVSGDWRSIGGALELVAVLSVNVPGFHKPRVSIREDQGIVAAMVMEVPVCRVDPIPDRVRVAERIAASIGRDRRSRVAALVARVHGGR